MSASLRLLVALALSPVVTLGSASAATHIYSYDPADAVTRQVAGPLTFELYKGLLGGTTVLRLRSTEAAATADLRRAAPGDLGSRRVIDALGVSADPRNIYEIKAADQGAPLISALCPGAKRAWLAFGPLDFDEELRIDVLGRGAAASQTTRVCHHLVYDFHGEWRVPPSGPVIKERDVLRGRYPGT